MFLKTTTTTRIFVFFFFFFTFPLILSASKILSRKLRKMNEITIYNQAEANIRLRCQSIKTDLKDSFLTPLTSYSFRFYDVDREDKHFWCDAYGLFGFNESFDVFGRSSPSLINQTWFLKNDGLYFGDDTNRIIEWQWIYPPLDSYSIPSFYSIDISPLPQ